MVSDAGHMLVVDFLTSVKDLNMFSIPHISLMCVQSLREQHTETFTSHVTFTNKTVHGINSTRTTATS